VKEKWKIKMSSVFFAKVFDTGLGKHCRGESDERRRIRGGKRRALTGPEGILASEERKRL